MTDCIVDTDYRCYYGYKLLRKKKGVSDMGFVFGVFCNLWSFLTRLYYRDNLVKKTINWIRRRIKCPYR
jgi:hypothetical protein